MIGVWRKGHKSITILHDVHSGCASVELSKDTQRNGDLVFSDAGQGLH